MNVSDNKHTFMNSVMGNEKAAVNQDYILSRDCFLQNAFFFLGNADRILSDPRMSKAHVEGGSGLAWGSFPSANLGIYLDWWLNSGIEDILNDGKGHIALTCIICR